MLHKVKLFVRGGRPKIVPFNNVFFFADFAVFGNDSGAAFFTERRIGQDDVETVAGIGGQGVGYQYR